MDQPDDELEDVKGSHCDKSVEFHVTPEHTSSQILEPTLGHPDHDDHSHDASGDLSAQSVELKADPEKVMPILMVLHVPFICFLKRYQRVDFTKVVLLTSNTLSNRILQLVG